MRRSLLLVFVIAAAAAALPAEAASPVYVRDPLTNRLAQHPSRIGFRDVDLTRLRWTNWGMTRATARGRANVLICEPSCAEGRRVSGTARVTVRLRGREGHRTVYKCIEGRLSGVPAEVRRISWQC